MRSRRQTLLIGWLLACVVIIAFSALGIWQWSRMQQKQTMLDAVARVITSKQAVSLQQAKATDTPYEWVQVTGHFIDAPALILDNQVYKQQPGVRIYRLFQSITNDVVLVELGWLPLPGQREFPVIEPIQGEQMIKGLLMSPPSSGLMQAQTSTIAQGQLATGIDIEQLRATYQQPTLLKRILKLDPENALGYTRDLDILPNTLPPERHKGYAVQWFGLALTVLIIAVVLTVRSFRQQTTTK